MQAEVAWLREHGVDLWYDAGLSPGAEWTDELAGHIKACTYFLFFVTPDAVASEHCRRELSFALDEGRIVLAVHLRKTHLPDGLRLSLNNRQAIMAFRLDTQDYRHALLGTLSGEHVEGVSPTRERKPWVIPATAFGLLLFILASLMFFGREQTSGSEKARLLVLPFEDLSGDVWNVDLVRGFSFAIYERLSLLPEFALVSPLAVDQAIDSGAALEEIGDSLKGDYIVQGAMRQGGRVTVRLDSVREQAQVWAHTFEGVESDVFAVQAQVALAIADVLQATLTADQVAQIEKADTTSRAAFEMFQRIQGLPANEPEVNRTAVTLTREVLDLDPEYADAHAHLAWLLVWQWRLRIAEVRAAARQSAERALAIDPENARANFAMASVLGSEGRLTAALDAYRKAVELRPGYNNADLSFSLSGVGAYVEAVRVQVEAVQLQPNIANSRWHLSIPLSVLDPERNRRMLLAALDHLSGEPYTQRLVYALLVADVLDGDYDSASEAVDRVIANDWLDQSPEARQTAAEALLFMGEWERARPLIERECEQAGSRAAGLLARRACAVNYGWLLWELGERERANELLDAAIARYSAWIGPEVEWSGGYVASAAIHALRGQDDEAIEYLEGAYDRGYLRNRLLRADPMFAGLREDPRFNNVLRRIDSDLGRMQAVAEKEGILQEVDRVITTY